MRLVRISDVPDLVGRPTKDLLIALESGSEDDRVAAMRALAASADIGARGAVVKSARNLHEDPWVHLFAVDYFKATCDVESLVELVLHGRDASVRSSAVMALGELGDETATTALFLALDDRSRDVRGDAMRVLTEGVQPLEVAEVERFLDVGSRRQRKVAASIMGGRK